MAVFAVGAGEGLGGGDGADFALLEVADGEEEAGDLEVIDLGEEVGLVFDVVGGGGEPSFAVGGGGGGVVAGGDAVEMAAPFFFEDAEFDELVAHHVGIGGEATAHSVNGIADDFFPIFFLKGDDFHRAAVFFGDERGDFDVFFGGAIDVAAGVFHADFDVKDGGVVPRLFQLVDNDGAVHASGN